MTRLSTRRSVALLVLTFFLVFTFDPPSAQAAQRPRFARVSFTVHARVKLTRRGGEIIPLELHVGNAVFPFVRNKGKWGVSLQASKMARLAPEFPQHLGLQIGAMATTRIRELVHGDRTAAEDIVKAQKTGRGKSFSPEESAFQQKISSAYRQVMAQQAFFFPEIQPDVPGQGGWWFVDDQSGDDSDHEGEEDEEDETSWFTDLMGLLLVTIIMIAPVAAAIWLAAQAITIATVTAAFLGSIGAVTAASLFTSTMLGIESLVTGNIYECWDNDPVEPHYPPGNHY